MCAAGVLHAPDWRACLHRQLCALVAAGARAPLWFVASRWRPHPAAAGQLRIMVLCLHAVLFSCYCRQGRGGAGILARTQARSLLHNIVPRAAP